MNGTWQKFVQTGDPMLYLKYKKCENNGKHRLTEELVAARETVSGEV